jgi:hypothetical protein
MTQDEIISEIRVNDFKLNELLTFVLQSDGTWKDRRNAVDENSILSLVIHLIKGRFIVTSSDWEMPQHFCLMKEFDDATSMIGFIVGFLNDFGD